MTVMSDALESVNAEIQRRKMYEIYRNSVVSARMKICTWIVARIVDRYRGEIRRSGVHVGLLAWLNEHGTLESSYSRVFGTATRRRWARQQLRTLMGDTMRLFEDKHSHKREAAKLIELLLNAQHDDEQWAIRVSVVRIPDYKVEGKDYKGYDSLRFDFDRRVPEHS